MAKSDLEYRNGSAGMAGIAAILWCSGSKSAVPSTPFPRYIISSRPAPRMAPKPSCRGGPIAAIRPGSGRSAPWSFAVTRWGDASGIDPPPPSSETPAGRALLGRSLARSAWWAQVYVARGDPWMRHYDGWISEVGARRGGGACPAWAISQGCEKWNMDYRCGTRTPLL